MGIFCLIQSKIAAIQLSTFITWAASSGMILQNPLATVTVVAPKIILLMLLVQAF